jgi:hypothetical protein
MNLDIIKYAIKELTRHLETDEAIWNNMQHPDLRRPIQNFLYKAMSGALRIGDFWSKIPNHKHRSNCPHCPDTLESLDHILTGCTHPSTPVKTGYVDISLLMLFYDDHINRQFCLCLELSDAHTR